MYKKKRTCNIPKLTNILVSIIIFAGIVSNLLHELRDTDFILLWLHADHLPQAWLVVTSLLGNYCGRVGQYLRQRVSRNGNALE